MRLLITLGFPPQHGGMQRYLYQRCLLSPQEMIVAAPGRGRSDAWDRAQPFPIWRWPGGPTGLPGWRRVWQTFWAFAALHHARRHYPIDVVEVGQALPFGLVGLWARTHLGLPYRVWAFGDEILKPAMHPLGRAFLAPVLRHADRVHTVSRYTAALVRPWASGEKVRVVHPWPGPQFSPGIQSEARVAVGLPADAPVLLTVARLEPRKGVDRVLRVLPDLVQRIPDLVYVVVGEGPARSAWERLATSLGVQAHVRWVGAVEDEALVAWYRAADVFVLVPTPGSGEVEGFGLVFVEAAACGLPAVAGMNGGTPEAVVHGCTGLLVFDDSERALINALLSLLLDRARRATMARHALAHANTLRERAHAHAPFL